jgi:crotonobetainyl-CoA:carnitine CoA-transferase CaiB-like acyl-CoA transferase
MGGIMHITGEPEREPMKIGVAFADVFTGLYAAIAIEAALIERSRSGLGQHIDMSLLDVMVGVLANQALNYLVSGVSPKRMGNSHPNVVPYQVFPTADGHVVIAVGTDAQFLRLCEILDLPELAADQRFQSNAGRVTARAELVASIAARAVRMTRAELLSALERAGVPTGPIHDIAEVFADPQVVARAMRLDLPAPDAAAGTVPGVRTPILFSRTPLSYEQASPRLGADTEALLADLADGKPLFRSSRE